MRIKILPALLLIIAYFSCVFYVGYRYGRHRGDRATMTLLHAKNSIIHAYSTTIRGLEVNVAEKEQEALSQREAIKQEIIYREELGKLNLKQVNEISRLKLRIDTLLTDVSHNGRIDTIYIDNKPTNCIILPFEFNKTDPWVSLKGSFDKFGKLNIDLALKADVDLWTGIDKNTGKPKAVLTTSNKYIQTLNISSYKFDTPKEKKYSIGLFIGYGVNIRDFKSSPVVGIGVTKSILRF